jgi:hypothetical protein
LFVVMVIKGSNITVFFSIIFVYLIYHWQFMFTWPFTFFSIEVWLYLCGSWNSCDSLNMDCGGPKIF